MAISPNTNFTTGQVLTATNANQWPRGVMAYTTRTSTIGLTTSLADMGISVTFTAEANRYYKYTFYAYAVNGSVANTLAFYLTDNSNNNLYVSNVYVPGGAFYPFAIMTGVRTESAGSVTRKIRGSTSSGTGSLYADSTNVAYLLVEDMGPA
jgi:hypothetical protein